MSEHKRYTAQEMREAADFFIRNSESVRQKVLSNSVLANIHESTAMLSQAADDAEELAKFKTRLEAVVTECEKQIPACRLEDCKCNPTDGGYCDENCHDEIIVHTAVTAILRVARGEGGTE